MGFKMQNNWIKSYDLKEEDIKKANDLVASDKYFRPLFHIAPPNGLMNDPNGLVFKDGVHYIHYQWSPLEPYHGFKHWRLVSTKDFVSYNDLGVSNIPEHPQEAWGAFSGAAYDFGDKIKIYYTGNMEDGNGNVLEEYQIAADFIDGKVVNKEVVVKPDFDKFTVHTRDPHIFEYKGQMYMTIGAQSKNDEKGAVVFYKLITPEKFEYFKTLKPSFPADYGVMWECPSFDKLGDKYLFIQASESWYKPSNKYELNSSRNVVYSAVKEFDFENNKINEEFEMVSMDYGYDFYAPQTYWCQDKLLTFGWLGNVGPQYPTDKYSWHSMMTIPRELSWAGNVLVQKPFADFSKNILGEKVKEKTDVVNVKKAVHLKFELDGNISFKIKNEKGEYLEVTFDDKEIMMDRSHQGEIVDWDFESPRYAIRKEEKQIVEIYIDASSIEMFADNYKTVFTSRFFVKDWSKIEFSKAIDMEISKVKTINLNK